jgi:hypothetical protein
MKSLSIAVVFFAFIQAAPGSAITSASVTAFSRLGGNCNDSSSGAQVSCSILGADSQASASDSQISVSAEAGGALGGTATATAELDLSFMLTGITTPFIEGFYTLMGQSLDEFGPLTVGFAIVQNGLKVPVGVTGVNTPTVGVFSTYTPGDPVTISITSTANACCDESLNASLTFDGVIGSATAPEPNMLSVVALCLAAGYFLRARRDQKQNPSWLESISEIGTGGFVSRF